MWSEESRGQQRGARRQQFEPEWTVTQAERAAATMVGGTISGVPKYQGMGLQDLLDNGQKRRISLS